MVSGDFDQKKKMTVQVTEFEGPYAACGWGHRVV
jgi:hypothetical protein